MATHNDICLQGRRANLLCLQSKRGYDFSIVTPLVLLVGARGLEPPASWSQSQIHSVRFYPNESQTAENNRIKNTNEYPKIPSFTRLSVPLWYRSRYPGIRKQDARIKESPPSPCRAKGETKNTNNLEVAYPCLSPLVKGA